MCKCLTWLKERFFGPSLPKVGQRTIDVPMDYLVQRTNRGSGPMVTINDMLTMRRHDWPPPLGWEICDCVKVDPFTALQTFDFVDPANAGDGGQMIKVGDDGFVRAISTRDGGTPYLQYFVGRNNGGTGWIFFGTDAPTGKWRELVATLAKSNWENDKPPLGKAFTRYRREQISMPVHEGSASGVGVFDCIISEHYDMETINQSQAMERSYFAHGFGLVRWEAWGRTSDAPVGDLHLRYQHVAYSNPPDHGWYLDDIRTYTNFVACEPTPVPIMS